MSNSDEDFLNASQVTMGAANSHNSEWLSYILPRERVKECIHMIDVLFLVAEIIDKI